MRVPVVLSFLLTLLIVSAATSAGQVQFSSQLRARITDDLSHEGVSTVRVTLTGTNLREPIVATTDSQGNLQIPGLLGGRYNLAIDKAGYFPQSFNDIVVGGDVTGNAPLELGDLNITAQRTASGTVKWNDGEPVANAIVHVMSFRGGAYSRSPFVAMVNTNDRGEFKVEGLRARRYLLFTYQRPQVVKPGTLVRVALPVFFPGTERPETAQMLDMRINREMPGLSLVLQEERGVSIEGTVTSDTLMPGSLAQLGLIIPGVPTPFIVGTETRVGEPFRLYPVPPGSYLLFARGIQAPTPPVAGAAPNPSPTVNLAAVPPSDPAVTAIPVIVNRETPITGLNVNLQAPTVITGKVDLDEAAQGLPSRIVPGRGANLFLEWVPKMESQYGFLTGTTNDAGEFRLTGGV
ncbi:MAG TPA: carboxypeptidase regulatory-like domain-containing protein, partial [Terriglobia bacterium]|nr:carboxypeptidase regulatory-like domain-containing protein [Terriglobia bacterium]